VRQTSGLIATIPLLAMCLAAGPTTRPVDADGQTSAPTTGPTVDQRIDDLLAPLATLRAPPSPANRNPKPVAGVVPWVREGTTIQKQLGRLGHTADGRTAVFTFEADPADPTAQVYAPMILLPNLELDAMERAHAAGAPTSFRISGLVTEYKGRNYLRVDRSAAEGDEQLLPRQERRATDRSSGRAAIDPSAPPLTLVRDGTRLVDRTGRLNTKADGSQAVLTFDTDNKTMRDAPMIVLPNLKLANMEGQRNGMAKDVKFRCSGTVTEYGGRNYILLDKAVACPDYDSEF
jgi:hypothetical protein